MKEMNDLVNELVADIEDIPADVPVVYEVWAIGHDEEDQVTDAEMMLASFEDPDMAVSYAKTVTLADVVNLAADDECDAATEAHSISIEVETVVPDEEGTMNIGTIYKKTLEIYEELPEYVILNGDEFEIVADGNIQVSCSLLEGYKEKDCFNVVFADATYPSPIPYRIISKTSSGYFICEFDL